MYNKPYLYDAVKPYKLVNAINYLVNKPLYKSQGVTLKTSWNSKDDWINDEHEIPFIVDKEDQFQNFLDHKNQDDMIVDENSSDDDNEDHFMAENTAFSNVDTMLHTQSSHYQNYIGKDGTLTDEYISEVTISPAENRGHEPYLEDWLNEELSFIKIYGGEKAIDYLSKASKFTYSSIVKWEIRNVDRRSSTNMEKIFYMYKRLTALMLLKSINICLQKANYIDLGLTVSDALDNNLMNDVMLSMEAQLMLRTIRSTPQYWTWKNMELNAMIRQLGQPTFFMTLSPAEKDWLELLIIVKKSLENKDMSIEDAKQISVKDRKSLLSRDPVTVARYFENRMSSLLKLVFNENSVFSDNPVTDYFWRVDSQYSGSLHIHILIWNKNSPVYEKVSQNSDLESRHMMLHQCRDFINKYITADRCINNELEDEFYPGITYNISPQFHRHMHNCSVKDKNGLNIDCKYGFPWPIMNTTEILEPFEHSDPSS